MTDEEKKQQLIKDYMQTFESPAGQRIVADLRSYSKIDNFLNMMGTTKTKNITPIQVAFAEGQRSMMMHIYAQLRKDPYAVKQTKAINERENEDG